MARITRQNRADGAKLILTIDILINNAGVMAIPTRLLTKNGHETTFATNHIAHFLFTNLLLPKMIKASSASTTIDSDSGLAPPNKNNKPHLLRPTFHKAPRRTTLVRGSLASEIIYLTGSTHTDEACYSFFSYGQSKTASILYVVSLSQELAKFNIAALAVPLAPWTRGSTGMRHLDGLIRLF
ncbi:uncharacterized protein LDX57_008203 [Aspergillus melleus]|uniref:uncharacterized protein n=1 Tax=Aspergillus melleus TaxID=138277 RepID=UPI001E8D28C0|nr:uncharacterized protein LDX57_008203 [Aspergillus melleus]KAH8430539.1 hypothetical protein LDX57_008203 [Aspergillus melleus]